jgi:hypothetical protein
MIEYLAIFGGLAALVLFLKLRPRIKQWLKDEGLEDEVDESLLFMDEVVEMMADQAIADGHVVELEQAQEALMLLRSGLLDKEMSPEAKAALRMGAQKAILKLAQATGFKF